MPTRSRPPRRRPLLCELHAHTTWSDGELGLDHLVDLHGARGFDVLCITDHVVHAADPRAHAVDARTHAAYLEAIDAVAERALRDHGLLVMPGLELTYSDVDADRAVHAVAVGLRRFVGVDGGPRAAMAEARAAGAAIIAAHPHAEERDPTPGRTTRGVYADPAHMRDLVDRYELVEPPQRLRVGGARAAAERGLRRCPPGRARDDVEDAPALRADPGGRRGRLPALRRARRT